MPSVSTRHVDILMDNPWFAELPTEIRDGMLACGRLRPLMDGQCLFRRGDPPDGFYAVLEGSIRISGVSREGREAVLNWYEPGIWFGEISMIDGLPRTHDAHAHAPSLLLQIVPIDFEALLTRHAALSRIFLRLGCMRLRLLLAGLEAVTTQPLENRFAGRLLTLLQAYGSPVAQGTCIDLHLSQEMLAQLVGTTRQRINQIVKQWEQQGLVQQRYGRIVVLDLQRFEQLAHD